MHYSKLALLIGKSSLLADVSSATSATLLGAIVGAFLIIMLVILVLCILLIVSLWKIYEKAGVPGWASLVPFYNITKLLQITNRPMWWIVLFFVPVVNIIIAILMARRLAAVFGKGVGFTWGLILLPFIFYPILAFGKATYANTFPPPGPMSDATKWALAAAAFYMLFESVAVGTAVNELAVSLQQPLTVISGNQGYAKDANYVYYDDQPISGADPATFSVKGYYAMDNDAVYYDGAVLPAVDPTDFTVLVGGQYATTSTQVYYGGSPVPGADPATFVVAEDPKGLELYDAKDKNGYYSAGGPYTLGSYKDSGASPQQ